ncbi:DUF1542 domain-containing protein [Leuconostoc sp. C2]|uniref:DUF1542 domain-containing protein n=1 Tax=Leuconostoc sp. (strain C2) TaxID=979982 RepID=UPI0002175A03|nr:DUF1542 domain-containing protein [Leuconostoc sp. C2]AEJ30753.1 Putative extracellular matrix binding protein [Leuconostoc sp. C2]
MDFTSTSNSNYLIEFRTYTATNGSLNFAGINFVNITPAGIPSINTVTEGQNTISGKASQSDTSTGGRTILKGDTVDVYQTNDQGQNVLVGRTTVDENNNWSLPLNNSAVLNQQYTAIVTNSHSGQKSTASNSIVQYNPSIHQQAYKQNLQDEHDKIVNDIANDPTLTSAEKAKQTNDADQALTNGQNNVDKSTTADDINKAYDQGKTAIDGTHVPGTNLDDQKTAQKQNLQAEHDKIVNDINNDPTLTTAEKQKQTNDADQALKNGQNAIDAANNVDEINSAYDQGKTNIDATHVPGINVHDPKSKHDKAISEIQNNPTLIIEKKQKSNVTANQSLRNSKSKIDNKVLPNTGTSDQAANNGILELIIGLTIGLTTFIKVRRNNKK